MMRILFGILLIVAFIYVLANWQTGIPFFGLLPEKKVELSELLSYANFYDNKKICTVGLYIKGPNLSIMKLDLKEDEFTKSIWVHNLSTEEIITSGQLGNDTKYTKAKLCGLFKTQRAGEYGTPAVWNHQLEVKKFENFTYPAPLP